MEVINCRNVNDGFIKALDKIEAEHIVLESRAGEVMEFPTPVTTVYKNPTERVLFEELRDANPFFHFMESLWMLAGRNDLAYVEQYNKRMREYSDDGVELHGAYGYRWIKHFDFDQVSCIIKRLKEDPNDRRSVLQMWDPRVDLNRKNAKDVPCNTAIYFKIRNGQLNMTVSNRSNDVIWGTFGANVVHMSMLQEYVARALKVRVGTYNQVSDSFHVYTEIFIKMWKKLAEDDAFDFYAMRHYTNPYENKALSPYRLMNVEKEVWDKDLDKFLKREPLGSKKFNDSFFTKVACPLQDAWFLYKQKDYEFALSEVQGCASGDWATAGFEWINRRVKS